MSEHWNEASPNSWGIPWFTDVKCEGCSARWEVRSKGAEPYRLLAFHCPCGHITKAPEKP